MSKSKQSKLEQELSWHLQPLQRRAFLKAGLIIGAGVSSLGLSGCSSGIDALPPGIVSLSPSQVSVFNKLIPVLLPTQQTQLASVTTIPVLKNIDTLLGKLDPDVQANLKIAADLFNYGSALFSTHFTRFEKLDEVDALSYIDTWQNGVTLQRGIAAALKRFVYVSYWRDERTWAALEFDGPVSEKWKLPSLGYAPQPV